MSPLRSVLKRCKVALSDTLAELLPKPGITSVGKPPQETGEYVTLNDACTCRATLPFGDSFERRDWRVPVLAPVDLVRADSTSICDQDARLFSAAIEKLQSGKALSCQQSP